MLTSMFPAAINFAKGWLRKSPWVAQNDIVARGEYRSIVQPSWEVPQKFLAMIKCSSCVRVKKPGHVRRCNGCIRRGCRSSLFVAYLDCSAGFL